METSTSTHPPKRVRFEDNEDSNTNTEDLQPIKIAIGVVETGLVLLPKTIRQTLTKLGIDYIKTHYKALHRRDRVLKLKGDPDYIPKSAWLEFALTPKKNVKDLQEFDAIAKKSKQQKKRLL